MSLSRVTPKNLSRAQPWSDHAMNKKVRFSSNFCSGVGIWQCFVFTPEREGNRTDISAITGAMKMIFEMNANRPPSNMMLL